MQKQLNILVTGGAGFIGSAVIANLQSVGHNIHVIDNLSFGNRKFLTIPDTHFHNVDILNAEQLDSLVQTISPDWLIHLAAIHFIPYCNQNPTEASLTNIQGTINVLSAAKKLKKLEKVFFASTAAVYPIVDQAIPESHRPEPTDIYGISKLAGEYLMNEFYLQTSIPTIIGRFFNAFGPNETNAHVIPEIQRQVNLGARTIQLGNLDPKRDFIHTSDMAIAISKLLNKFDQGIDTFNIGRGIEYSIREVVQAFEQSLGAEITIQVDPSRVRKVERMHLLADISKLTSFINWEPQISLSQGINTLIETQESL
ncbi:NAD-dependent epimerase/dehydratase family protein [Phormidium tenue]|jgi:UDP-glucose 4-epimerase|uniref:NAD(P)-dependent oxidoreductase n=1 Tax=Phormidium tenue FACHB-1050 TaxID=2692857 RepID=A0ABR8CEZ6_9CYAN|nr:NAD(P)-dependent oxidoreductase [Phormidium tenue]MBD2319204.1 NAD(P)-dependent oxidoreductase [Phormidium tenue FACHB-1050]